MRKGWLRVTPWCRSTYQQIWFHSKDLQYFIMVSRTLIITPLKLVTAQRSHLLVILVSRTLVLSIPAWQTMLLVPWLQIPHLRPWITLEPSSPIPIAWITPRQPIYPPKLQAAVLVSLLDHVILFGFWWIQTWVVGLSASSSGLHGLKLVIAASTAYAAVYIASNWCELRRYFEAVVFLSQP